MGSLCKHPVVNQVTEQVPRSQPVRQAFDEAHPLTKHLSPLIGKTIVASVHSACIHFSINHADIAVSYATGAISSTPVIRPWVEYCRTNQ
jgi:hypothetical protein